MSDTSPISASSPESSRHLKIAQSSIPSSVQRGKRPTIQTSRQSTSRLPPPQLFQNPPSHNASHISLALPPTSPSTTFSTSSPETTRGPQSPRDQPRPSHVPPASSFSGASISAAADRPSRLPGLPRSNNGKNTTTTTATATTTQTDNRPNGAHKQQLSRQDPDDQRTDVLWAEMQNTLAEVELSTTMNASHVFGEGHVRALEELRAAQLGLARAWARNDVQEQDGEDGIPDQNTSGKNGGANGDGAGGVAAAAGHQGDVKEGLVIGALREGMLGVGSSPSNNGMKNGSDHKPPVPHTGPHSKKEDGNKRKDSTTLEEETERDMLLARKRREANDRYFQQVNNGVLDVVRKLEEVAAAMRRVERESREIWKEEEEDDDDDEDEDHDDDGEQEEEVEEQGGGDDGEDEGAEADVGDDEDEDDREDNGHHEHGLPQTRRGRYA